MQPDELGKEPNDEEDCEVERNMDDEDAAIKSLQRSVVSDQLRKPMH